MKPSYRHPLRGLLIAQFWGAFNDNAWKMIVVLLAMRGLTPDSEHYQVLLQRETMAAFVVFSLPLVIFSIPAGVIADRLSKRFVSVAMKLLEVFLMGAGMAALYFNPGNTVFPLMVLGLMGMQSAIFSPAKYGILPELLPHHRLSAGNAQLQMWTFLAIILGTGAGGVLLQLSGDSVWIGGAVLLVFAVIGYVASLEIPRVPPARSEGGMIDTLASGWRAIRADRPLWLAVQGTIAYWSIASLLGQNVIVYTRVITEGNSYSESLVGLPLAAFGIGIGVGSLLAGKLSASKVEYGLIPLGAVGLGIFTLAMGLSNPQFTGTMIYMTMLGVSSGLLTVPLAALIQWRAPEDRRGAVIALSNVFVFWGTMLGSLAVSGMAELGLTCQTINIITAVAVLIGTFAAVRLLPEALLRLCMILITNTVYRVKIIGRDHIPAEGGVLLVPNHVSFIDGLLVQAGTDRPVRFMVHTSIYEKKWLQPLFQLVGAMPIASTDNPRKTLQTIRQAGEFLDQGEVVCIFAEGQISRTGMMQPFKSGFSRIVNGRNAKIVPVNLDRVWGSIFSCEGGRFFTKLPSQVPYPVTVSFGEPMPPDTPPEKIRQTVHELGERAWHERQAERRPLHHTFVRNSRRIPFHAGFADAAKPRVRRIQGLAGAITLARALRNHWTGHDQVGIMLPAGVAGALVNYAAAFAGKITVNLNFTVGRTNLESAVMQAELRTVVTSRTFIEKAKLELPQNVTPIWLEDIAQTITKWEKLSSLFLAIAAPVRIIERVCGAPRKIAASDAVTIIFSSGSEGDPKGVTLSHANIDSNIEGAAQIFPFTKEDRILGILPFFHSFGYLAALWLISNHRVGVVYHPNPLDAPAIENLIEKYRITYLVSTPTFLQIYIRRCTPASFGSLRLVLTGAEKLPVRVARTFEERFGIRPIEGYGVTETSPVISANGITVRGPGIFQNAARPGTVGQPIPGVAVRIVDPETMEPLPVGEAGMILVRGPNVMQGYWKRPDLTQSVMHNEWYITGDIGKVDEDGFITITDRYSRFSKIGGEMVPHGRIEEALQAATNREEQVLAVTAVPDDRKGERIAVLHTLDEKEIPTILDAVVSNGLPNLFIPRREDFVRVDSLPILGSGKLDLQTLKRIACETLAGSEEQA